MPAVEGVAVTVADAIDHAHLQRHDGHGGEVLRQELQRAIQYRIIDDHLVDGFGGHRLQRRRQGAASGPGGHDGGRRRSRLGGGHGGAGIQRAPQGIEEDALPIVDGPVRLAYARRHLERQGARLRRGQPGRDIFERAVVGEHLLVNLPKIDPGIGTEALRHAPQGGVLHFAVLAIRKSGHHGDGKNDFLFGGRHIGGGHCHMAPSCSNYDPAGRFQPWVSDRGGAVR